MTYTEFMEEHSTEQTQKKLAVGVQFRPAGKIYTFVTDDNTLSHGDRVVVESEDGTSLGLIAMAPYEADEKSLPANVKKLLHKAGEEDIDEAAGLRERAIECFHACRERIRSRALPMKLVDVDISENGKKAVFTFFAENRVDFRALVKDLAGLLRMRIEMRQIGSRDEAKIAGCMGPCGQTTCCSTHLRQFQSISISMAKHQGLAPNPAKLTGMCGKLKCCLAYEQAAYDECRNGLPKVGSAVESPDGPGKIVGHNVLKRECTVRLYAGGEARVPCDKCRKFSPEEREKAIAAAKRAKEEGEEKTRRRSKKGGERKEGRNAKSRK
ncbi:MAG: regulatory iron-sulfur-containing complex subunit RicT [Pseudomonadota bacterium]